MLMGVTSNRVDVKRRARAGRARSWSGGPSRWPRCSEPPATSPTRLLELAWQRDGAQLRPRLHLRLLGGRRGRRRPAPLRRGPRHRRRAGRPGRQRVRPLDGRTRPLRAQCVAAVPGRAWSSWWSPPTAGPRPDVQVLSERLGPPGVDGARRRHGAHDARACCRAPRSTTTPGCTTSWIEDDRRGHRHHLRRRHPRSGPTCPSPRPSRTSTPGWGPAPTPWSASPWTSRPTRRIVGPHGRGARVRLARLRAGRRWPTRSEVERARRDPVVARQRPGRASRSTRPTGTFALDGIAGYGRLVDGGDLGDSYNYSPPQQRLARRHARVGHRAGRRAGPGPGAGSGHRPPTRWPDHVDGGSQRTGRASSRSTSTPTSSCGPTSRWSGSRRRSSTRARDHRLRVHLPLPEPAEPVAHAESAFTVVERGLTAEGRADEFGCPPLPSDRFVYGRRPDRRPRGRAASTSWSTSPTGTARRATTLALTAAARRPACCPASAWPTAPSRPAR